MINSMKYLSLLCLLCLLTPVQADIYKSTDSEGQTVYSDQKLPDSEKMPAPTENVIQMPKLIIITPPKETEDGETYVYLNIDKPVNDEILRDNLGNLPVHLSIKPALHTEDGHYLALFLDGEAVTPDAKPGPEAETEEDIIPDSIKMDIQLSNISRGEHAIYAEVINEEGEALITSNTVIFHMKRHSIQHKKPFGTPPGPLDGTGQLYSP